MFDHEFIQTDKSSPNFILTKQSDYQLIYIVWRYIKQMKEQSDHQIIQVFS